jgi:Zn-dependent metalloprotease
VIAKIHETCEKAPGKTPEEIAMNYIKANQFRLGIRGLCEQTLKHYFSYDGGVLKVIRFRQYHSGVPVDENEIVITLNNRNEIVNLSNQVIPLPESLNWDSKLENTDAINIATKAFNPKSEISIQKVDRIFHEHNGAFYAAYKISLTTNWPQGSWAYYLNARTGVEIERKSLDFHFQASTTIGTGFVYDPDPVSMARSTYAAPLSHNNDATNPTLDALRRSVTFEVGNNFAPALNRLRGRYAYNVLNTCETSSNQWSFNRSESCFESVMAYYHITQSMMEYEALGGAQPNLITENPWAAKFQVFHNPGNLLSAAIYSSSTGVLNFNTYENNDGKTMDTAEDAAVIVHELGHGVNNWMTGNQPSENEGLGEGFADYWSQSYCRNKKIWKEFEPQYHRCSNWFMFTDELADNLDRTTDVPQNYDQISSLIEIHQKGQIFSKALMRIYDDIGKAKTDYIALRGMAMTEGGDGQINAVKYIYQAATLSNQASGYITNSDLCIIYNHFSTIYGPDFDVTPSAGAGDYFIRDTEDDKGQEPNPDNGPMWLSPDIWVRSGDDDGETIRESENPVYGDNNYIYVRVRSRGCAPVTDAQLHVYFSKASSSLSWPTNWINYYINTTFGPKLAGDEVNGSPVILPNNLKAGEEIIVKIPWTNLPNPAQFPYDKHHFCLLARIESVQDPMAVPETSNTGDNTRKNNNIGWKNITILGGSNVVIAGVINIKQADSPAAQNSVVITNPGLPGTVPCTDQGVVRVDLKGGLKTVWDNGGNKGEHIVLQNDGKIQLTMANAVIGDLSMSANALYYLELQYTPDSGAKSCVIDLAQTNGEGKVVGGERFIYEPQGTGGAERSQFQYAAATPRQVKVFPTIIQEWLYVELPFIEPVPSTIRIMLIDSKGQLWLEQESTLSAGVPMAVQVAALPAGIYWVKIVDEQTTWQSTKVIKY